ncbi:unnamed protein product [Dicrocoelium dendriticum]|nr:unnamed protein product [Dicrocoelium dendriticum]
MRNQITIYKGSVINPSHQIFSSQINGSKVIALQVLKHFYKVSLILSISSVSCQLTPVFKIFDGRFPERAKFSL